MRKRIAISGYTKPGDPLRIDCGYRPNGVVRMFHAVSLDSDTEWPKVLAFSAAAIREGVARVENAKLELNGSWVGTDCCWVTTDREDADRVAQYRFSVRDDGSGGHSGVDDERFAQDGRDGTEESCAW